jgi:hypothetical protein
MIECLANHQWWFNISEISSGQSIPQSEDFFQRQWPRMARFKQFLLKYFYIWSHVSS